MLISHFSHFGHSRLVHSTYNSLKASAAVDSISQEKQLHSLAIKLGLLNELSLLNKILNFYVKCRDFDHARQLFGEMSVRNVVSWNTIISGLFYCGHGSDFKMRRYLSFSYFKTMLLEMVAPDDITFNGLFRSCVELNDIESGRQLHGFIIKTGFDLSCFVGSAVVDLYAKCGLYEDARLAFSRIVYKDIVLWNVMLYCYVYNYLTKEAIEVFNLMQLEGIKGDDFTFSSLLSSCNYVGMENMGKQLHGLLIKQSFDLDILVASSLANMYNKNKNLDAIKVFEEMPRRNSICWTTMIVGYGQQGYGKEALKLFVRMFQEVYPDELAFASLLSSCGFSSGPIELMQLHSCQIKLGFEAFLPVNNALINAYSKCGIITAALQCFSLNLDLDLITWTSIIYGLSFCGHEKEAVEFFEEMLSSGTIPDGIAFLGVLSACSHGGFINKGLQYFNMMINQYQIIPDMEHFTCLIDLMGRAGLLDEAFNLMKSMKNKNFPNAFRTLLRACRSYSNLGLAKCVMEFASEPMEAVDYSLMSNIFASEGRWLDVAKMRKLMRENCEQKAPGCSWVDVRGQYHSFVSSDRSHPESLELYTISELLLKVMKENYNSAVFDLNTM